MFWRVLIQQVLVVGNSAKAELVDNDGDSHMDSDSDATAAAGSESGATPARSPAPAFSAIGSPTVPAPESLQAAPVVDGSSETKKASSD